MKKLFFAAIAATFSFLGASAQSTHDGGPGCTTCPPVEECGNCWRDVYEECSVPVKISIRDIIKLECDGCASICKCVNSSEGYLSEFAIGSASFKVSSTKPYDAVIGVDDNKWDNVSTVYNPGSTIPYGTGLGQMELRARVTSNPGGLQAPFTSFASESLLPMTTNGISQSGITGGSQILNESPAAYASTPSVLAVDFSINRVPMGTPEGDYEINVLYAAYID